MNEEKMIDNEQYGFNEVGEVKEISFDKTRSSRFLHVSIEYEEFDPISVPFVRGHIIIDEKCNLKDMLVYYKVWFMDHNGSSQDLVTKDKHKEKIKKVIQEKLKKDRIRIILGVKV